MRVSGATLMRSGVLVVFGVAGCATSPTKSPVEPAVVAATPAVAAEDEGPINFVCPGGPPVGPGAATRADLAPWLAAAPAVTYTGELMYFHCTSEHGNYWTWSIGPAGPDDAAEIDIRACTGDAQRLWNQQVTIKGLLIERGVRHFPLLVAESIQPAEPDTMLVAR